MKRNLLTILAVCLMFSAALPALAQEGSPSKVIQIFREEVKYGKGSAHEKNEAAFVAAFKRAKWPTTYLAIASATGLAVTGGSDFHGEGHGPDRPGAVSLPRDDYERLLERRRTQTRSG